MKWFKLLIKGIFLSILAIVIIIASCNMIVIHYSKDKLYDNAKDIPYKEVGLLLGTSPRTKDGHAISIMLTGSKPQ